MGYICSGPVICICLEGDGVVASCRKLIGATKPLDAEPGTIRGDLAVQVGRNVVHGSDSPENGERELGKICCKLSEELVADASIWILTCIVRYEQLYGSRKKRSASGFHP